MQKQTCQNHRKGNNFSTSCKGVKAPGVYFSAIYSVLSPMRVINSKKTLHLQANIIFILHLLLSSRFMKIHRHNPVDKSKSECIQHRHTDTKYISLFYSQHPTNLSTIYSRMIDNASRLECNNTSATRPNSGSCCQPLGNARRHRRLLFSFSQTKSDRVKTVLQRANLCVKLIIVLYIHFKQNSFWKWMNSIGNFRLSFFLDTILASLIQICKASINSL